MLINTTFLLFVSVYIYKIKQMSDPHGQIWKTHKSFIPFYMATSGSYWIGSDIHDGRNDVIVETQTFITKKLSDPEQLCQDFTKYVNNVKEFLIATSADGAHTDNHNNCNGCTKAKATLRLVGRENMKSLFDHVGSVVEADTFEETITKVSDGIRRQTNQATARYQLFQ